MSGAAVSGTAGEGAASGAAPATDRCPRCGGGFRCGVDDPAPCCCSAVPLAPALQQRLRARYTGCLCPRCLQALAAGDPLEPGAGAGSGITSGRREAGAAT